MGFAGLFYNLKFSGFGTSLLPVTKDIEYMVLDIYHGKTMISSIFWVFGSILIMVATILWLIDENKNAVYKKITSLFILIGGIGYLVSIFFQYGFLFHGPAGIAVPFGIPLIFYLGYIVYSTDFQ